MHHAFESNIMDKSSLADHLCGEVDARHVPPDDPIFARFLGWWTAGGVVSEVDSGGERPIIMAGRHAAVGYGAVAYRQIRARVAEARGGMVEEQGAHLGACLAQCDAAELDRLAARGVAFVWGQIGVAGLQQDAFGSDVELVGGDLQHRGQYSLADLDPAGRNRNAAGRGKPDPLVEPRVGGEQRRQGWRWAPRAAPSRNRR